MKHSVKLVSYSSTVKGFLTSAVMVLGTSVGLSVTVAARAFQKISGVCADHFTANRTYSSAGN